jgi:hypothetical protein
MKGRKPKPDALRQRRNRVVGAAQLPTAEASQDNEVPELPARDGEPWHPKALKWWESVWRSPMASEYLEADRTGGLYLLAELYHARWTQPENVVKIAAEIRQQEVRFGLSPIDRTRLRWEIDKGETAAERTEKRRASKAPAMPKGKDPRAALKLA